MSTENWITVSLGNVAQYINGRAFKPSDWEKSGLPIIRIQNLTKSSNVVNYTSKKHEDKYFVQDGDVLMAWSATLDVFIWNDGPAWLNQHIFNVKEFENIVTRKFLFFSLKQAIADFYTKTHGTGMVHVTKPIFEAHEIPLPPLNEQKRIVAKLDKIIPRIDSVKRRLENVPIILKRFRQSVLTAAVTGKLTEKWREEHPDVESATNYVLKAKEIKEKKYQEDCESAIKSGRRKPKPIFFNDRNINFDIIDLPDSWCATYLGNLSYVQGGIQKTPKRKPVKNFYRYVTVANVYRGFLKLDQLSSFELSKNEFRQLKLQNNDLLIVEGNGSAKEIGRCAIWRDNVEDCVHQNHIIRSRPIKEVIENEYSLLFLNSNFGIKIMMDVASTTSGLFTLSVSKVNNLPIPVPPLEEQKEIVRQVEKLFALADKLEDHYKRAKEHVDKLSQSVLAKAFRGELVPQDPNDEPAEKLLERIMAEKEKMEAALKKNKRKPK